MDSSAVQFLALPRVVQARQSISKYIQTCLYGLFLEERQIATVRDNRNDSIIRLLMSNLWSIIEHYIREMAHFGK